MTTLGERGAQVALPGEPGFDAATQVFNLAAPARPAAAVTVRTADEVRAAVRHARAAGLPLRVHATGHAAAAVPPMDGALLIRTEPDGPVVVDAAAGVARVPAGTRWGAVVDATAPYGLAAPHGSSPTVGVVGYLLRGGMSFYGRRVGLASNLVRALELVTADGALRRVDAADDPELFWALRGGGGGLGVVTAVEVGLFPAARVVTGAAFWAGEHAPELLARWRRWTLDAPREVTTSLRIMNLPPVPNVPPPLAGRMTVSVDGCVLCPTAADVPAGQAIADALLGPLRDVAEPLLDSWQLTTPADAVHAHMDPTDPVPILGDHMLLSELGDAGAAAFLAAAGAGSGSPLIVAGLRQLGGAYAEPDPAGGALSCLDAAYSYAGSGVPFDPAVAAALTAHAAAVRTALRPWDTGRTAPSFVENVHQPQGHLSPAEIARVDAVRRRIDPDGLFRTDITPNATALR